jgi:precorrin-3B C17-methyltransferase
LSNNLKSWETIERRLRAAAEGDFVIALYNPASKARPHQLGQAFDVLRGIKPPRTVVLFVRRAATPETRIIITDLAEADPTLADMGTLVIIGATATRLISREGQRPWVYTPRAEQGAVR